MRKTLPKLVFAALLVAPSLSLAAEAQVAAGHAVVATGGAGDGGAQTVPAAQAPLGVEPATHSSESDNWTWKDEQGRTCRWSQQPAANGSGGEAQHWLQVCK